MSTTSTTDVATRHRLYRTGILNAILSIGLTYEVLHRGLPLGPAIAVVGPSFITTPNQWSGL